MHSFERTIAAAHNFGPPGHFYSPHPLIEDVESNYNKWTHRSGMANGLDLDALGQRAHLAAAFVPGFVGQWPVSPEAQFRYYTDNHFFRFGDAQAVYAMAALHRPAKIVEVGSGFSTACWLDATDSLGFSPAITAIEPYPDRLLSLLRTDDLSRRVELVQTPVQAVAMGVFSRLEANDVLFIDSTHVAKAGSDVNYLIFEVLPNLAPGVLVHFHDIFWPFEYPKIWLLEGRAWNEAYILHAFLTFNGAYRILRFNSYLAHEHAEAFSGQDPRFLSDSGGSLWIQRR